MIEVKNINKYFDNKQVLHDINIVFEKGKQNLIIGQSGSGKTVLIKCLVGLFEPDTGQVLFDDRDFTSMNLKQKKNIRKEMECFFKGVLFLIA